MKAKHSIARVYKVIAVILVPTVFLALFFTVYIRNEMTERVVGMFSSRIRNSEKEQSRQFYSIDRLMTDLLINDEDVEEIRNHENTDYHLRKISQKFTEISGYFGGDYSFFIFIPGTDTVLVSPSAVKTNQTPDLAEDLKKELGTETEEETVDRSWDILILSSGETIIYNASYSSGIYIGCFITAEDFYNNFYVNAEDTPEYMFLLKDGEFVDAAQVDQYEKITHHADMVVNAEGDIYRNPTYWVRLDHLDRTEFDCIVAAKVLGEYGWVLLVLYGVILVSLVTLGIGIWLLKHVQKHLIRPLNNFIETFSQEETYTEDKYSPFAFDEISQINSMYAKAEKQIEVLKIEVYEKELEQQKMELSFLQSQVHPHFYLNNMSVFYAMAEAGRTREIKQLSMEIAAYFRFLLRDGSKLVVLAQELEHVQRYLNIYRIRFEDELNYSLICSEDCKDALIPPLMIQTMVENSFKYARQPDQVLTISVKIEKIKKDGSDVLSIVVSDNGPGFPEEVLKDLKNGVNVAGHDGYGIGLSNTIKRIRYFYPEKGSIEFLNGKYEGAIVRMELPYQKNTAE